MLLKNKFGRPTKQNSSLNKSFMRSSDSSFAFNESQYSKSVSNAPLYFRSISEPLEEPLDGIVAKPISTKIKIFLNISACDNSTTSHQARFPIMKLFSFTLVALGLTQGVSPIQSVPIQKEDTGIERLDRFTTTIRELHQDRLFLVLLKCVQKAFTKSNMPRS